MVFNEMLLKLITFLHVVCVLFVVGVPFSNSNYFLLLHTIFVPFVVLHWVANNNTCVLTIIEKYLRIKIYGALTAKDQQCFTCKLIEPIYDFKKNNASMSSFIYLITFLLWLTSASKLAYKYKTGKIVGWRDLFKV